MAHDEELVTFAAARGPALRRTAYLLCGDWHTAEDLVQETFARLYPRWGRRSTRRWATVSSSAWTTACR